MSTDRPEPNDRLLDLLIQNATIGISEHDQTEFNALISSPDNHEEAERFEITAAAIDLSLSGESSEDMPRSVHDRLLVEAGAFFGQDDSDPEDRVELSKVVEKANRFSWREAIALAVTAACIAVMMSGYNPFAEPVTPQVAATAEQNLSRLVRRAPDDLVRVSWKQVHSPTTSGRVVWSDSRQEGYMEFEGLPVNNPDTEQYQLWIFDTDKTQKYPVDGGVFDIFVEGKTIIPIDAKIPVDKAVMFAVTREKPGGVVVSDRKRLPVLAEVGPTP